MSVLATTQEEADFARSVHDLATKNFGQSSSSVEQHAESFRHALVLLAEAGLAGIALPEDEGGQGGNLADSLIAMDELTYVSVRAGDALQALNFGAIRQVASLATSEVKGEWLAPALEGKALLGVAMSEPDVGSDLSKMRTKAVRRPGEVVLSGEKIFSTHGTDSDAVVVWCRFGPDASDLGAVLVPTDAPGFERGVTERFMSGEPYCVMTMDGCAVPERYILSDSDLFATLFPVFNVERLGNAGRSLSAARRTFDLARDYAIERQIDGASLSEKQGIRWKFADMRMSLEASYLMLERAAREVNAEGFPGADQTALAKAFINREAFAVAHEALQVMGASGYSSEFPVEYIFRRIRGWMIAGGTIEVLKNRIAREVFRPTPRRQDA